MEEKHGNLSFGSFFGAIFRQAPGKITFLVVCMLVAGSLESVGFALFIPLIKTITSNSGQYLVILLAAIVAVIALKNAFLYFQKLFTAGVGIDFEVGLKEKIYGSVFASDWKFYLNQKTGTLNNAVTNGARVAAMAFQVAAQLAAELVNVLFYCAVGMIISYKAFLMSGVAGLIYVYFSKNIIIRSRFLGKEGVEAANDAQRHMLEDLSGIKFIKGNRLENERRSALFGLLRKIGALQFRSEKYMALLDTMPELAMVVIMCAIFYVSYMYLKVPGENLLVLVAVLYRFNRRVMTIQTLRQRLVNYLPSYELCDGIISSARALKEETGTRKFTKLADAIRFDDVSFDYSGQSVLEAVSFEIRKNSFTSFLGKSGSGKTTILDLVMALLKAGGGRVTVDGVPISEYDLFSLRERIGYVPQDPFMVNGTIAENIRLGNGDISDKEIEASARAAYANEFIEELPQRYNTVVGDRGMKLSGGQRQRIALARALARRPEILILDEATSALDNRSENMIQEAINGLKGSLTMIVVAHRLTTISNADIIYVLNGKKITASGNLGELRRSSKDFQEIYMGGVI